MNNEKTFEQQLQELEQIVNNLEKGNVPLEEAMAQFKAGIDLSNTLQKTLNDAEETLTKVINSNGEEEIYERADDICNSSIRARLSMIRWLIRLMPAESASDR